MNAPNPETDATQELQDIGEVLREIRGKFATLNRELPGMLQEMIETQKDIRAILREAQRIANRWLALVRGEHDG